MNRGAARAVVTGLGAITPAGLGADRLWDAVRAGRPACAPVTRFDASPFGCRVAAEIADFDPHAHFPGHRLKRLDRYAQLAVASAREALADAGLAPGPAPLRARFGVSLGTALGGIGQAEGPLRAFLEKGAEGIPPGLALQVFGGSGHSQIAIEFGLAGPGITNANSCAAGAVAVGEAWRLIRDGWCDVVIAGGAEAPLCPLAFGAFDRLGVLAPGPYRIFDRGRAGFVMGEGSAALVLESLAHARARGARIYAEVLGYALTTDAWHMATPREDRTTIEACMRLALERADTPPREIDYVSAHASGTRLNDATEAAAIAAVLGPRAEVAFTGGTKPVHGHSLGAAAAIECVAVCRMFRDPWIPPIANLVEPEPGLPVRLPTQGGVAAPVRRVLKNAFGFGGVNCALVFGAAP